MGIWSKKWASIAVAVIAPLSLGGCLILPGEFVSAMTVRKNGDFSFSYKGQIQLVGLANLLNNDFMGLDSKPEFKATCYSENIEPVSENNDLKVEVERDDVAARSDATFAVVPAAYYRNIALADPEPQDDVAKATAEAAKAMDEAA